MGKSLFPYKLGTLIVAEVDDTGELPLHCPSAQTDRPRIVLVLPHTYLSVPTAGPMGRVTVWIGAPPIAVWENCHKMAAE